MNTPKRERGRPKLPANQKPISFKMKLKPAQLELLRATAAMQGVSMSALAAIAIAKELEAITNGNNKPINPDNQCDWVSD